MLFERGSPRDVLDDEAFREEFDAIVEIWPCR
jgi:hypothetical protein